VTAGPQGVFVALSRSLTGRIKLKALSETHILPEAVPKIHPPGSLITDMTVIYISETGKVELSLRTDDGLTAEQLSVGDIVSGRVKKVEPYGLFVRLDNSRTDAFIHRSEISDSASTTVDSYKVGTKIAQAKVLKIEGQKIGLTIKPSNFSAEDVEEDGSDSDDVQELLAAAREKMKGKKRKKGKTDETLEDEEVETPVTKAPKVKAKKRKQPEKVEENVAFLQFFLSRSN
jgi:rRNA biogenesis protein RRP5